jgi:hypothetical protein
MKLKTKGKAAAPVKAPVKSKVKAARVETPESEVKPAGAVIDTKNFACDRSRGASGNP